MEPLVVAMPGRSDLLIPFKHDEVQAGLSQTRADRKSGGTGPDDGNVCLFWHLLLPLERISFNWNSLGSLLDITQWWPPAELKVIAC